MQARLASLKEELVRMSRGEGASGGGEASTPADAPVSKESAPAAAAGNAASAGYGAREKTLAAHGPATQVLSLETGARALVYRSTCFRLARRLLRRMGLRHRCLV